MKPVHAVCLLALGAALSGCPTPPPEEEPPPAWDPGLDQPPAWSWCAGDQSDPGTGEAALLATTDALYCAVFDEERTLQQEREARAMVRLVGGSVAIPGSDGVVELTVEACGLHESGAELSTAGPGVLDVATDLGGSERYRLLLNQPLRASDDAPWELVAWLQGPTAELVDDGDVTLDGSHVGLATDPDHTVILQLCDGSCLNTADGVLLDSCSFDRVPTQRHHVEFDGGWIDLDLRVGQALFITQPALFVGGQGALDGVEFEQRDYWQLLYNPIHHHFSRDFVVFFDEPIAGACGLKVEHLDPWEDSPPVRVSTVDCELNELGSRTVVDDMFTNSVQ